MSFISDFLERNSGTECPKNYLRWSAIMGLAVAAQKRYFLRQGPVRIFPTQSTVLVGEQGSRKSYGKDRIKDLTLRAFPSIPIGRDIQSREDIIKAMAQPDAQRVFKNHLGVSVPFTPIVFYVNELKHFLSFNPSGMIEFLTNIWDLPAFSSGTIARSGEMIELPSINILACETPNWIMEKLKLGIISGGFSRRFLFIYEPYDAKISIPEPFDPPGWENLETRMIGHLTSVSGHAAEYKWDAKGKDFFYDWYHTNKKELGQADLMMRGFLRTKDQHLLRVSMLLDLDQAIPTYTITKDNIEIALTLFDAIEPNIPRLFVASGRNELALPIQRLIDIIDEHGGIILEKKLKVLLEPHMNPMEQMTTMRYLKDNDRIVQADVKWPPGSQIKRAVVIAPWKYDELKKVEANGQ